jgi:hypothetical protein
MRGVVAGIAVAGYAAVAHADNSSTVTVQLNQNGAQLASYLNLSVPDLITNAESQFNTLFQTAQLPQLLQAFASTSAIANHGLGVDYAVIPGELMIGFVANGEIATDASFGSSSHELGGIVFNLAVMAGANLGRWGLPRWTVFANGYYETESYHGLDGHLATGGVHVQYAIVPEQRHGAISWLGLDATTGFEYAYSTIGKSDTLPIKFKVYNPAGDSEHLTMEATGTLSVVAKASTVPIEVTTGIRLWRHLAVYAGGGIDVTVAPATIDVALSGDIDITSNMENVGTAQVTASGSASPGVFTVHALAGIQLNVPYVHFYAQGVISPADESVDVGLRLAF